MFIYMGKGEKHSDCRYIINRIFTGSCFYYEILFFRPPSKELTAKAVRRCTRRKIPITQNGFPLREDLKKRCIHTEKFDRLLLFNAFCQAVSGQERALICDKNAVFAEMLSQALTCVKELFVWTERPDIYDGFAKQALCTAGNSPIFTDLRNAHGFSAILQSEQQDICDGTIFGIGGFMPYGDTVIYKKREYDKALAEALFMFDKEFKLSAVLPKLLKNSIDTAEFPHFDKIP